MEWSNQIIPCVCVCESAPRFKHLMHNHKVSSVNFYLRCIHVFVTVSKRSVKYYVKS